MKFDLSIEFKVSMARNYFEDLIKKKSWIELKEIRIPHSIDSHKLYFAWLNCIAKETGHDKDELHYLYRATFLPKDEDYIMKILNENLWKNVKKRLVNFQYFDGLNLVIDIISESTAIYLNNNAQDQKKWSQYLENIRNHARVNMGVILLSKDDENFKEFYKEYIN